MKREAQVVVLALVTNLVAGAAHASCGAAFCATSNDWLALTQGAAPGWRVWAQMETLTQDRLRAGSNTRSSADVITDHKETRTLNRNLLVGMGHGIGPGWSASLVVPYTDRNHSHLLDGGTPVAETWHFKRLGDARMALRRQLGDGDGWSGNLQGGLKLPTGDTGMRNAAGEVAERSVQPGSGTWDLLLGAGLSYAPLSAPGYPFAQLSLQAPLAADDGYRPGARAAVQAGWLLPVAPRLDLVLQGNVLYVAADRGVNAEPADTGRVEIAFVPVVTYAWSRVLSVYAQLELPVHQHVRGVQLTHDYAVAAGFSLALD